MQKGWINLADSKPDLPLRNLSTAIPLESITISSTYRVTDEMQYLFSISP